MIDQLIQSAQEHLTPQLQSIGVRPEQMSSVFNVAQGSVTEGLKGEALGDGLNSVLNLFNGQGGNLQSNSIVSSIAQNFVESLVSKVGLDASIANKVSGMVIPFIMEKFAGHDSGSASSATDLMSLLNFGNGSDLSSSLSNMTGEKDRAGDLLSNLGNLF